MAYTVGFYTLGCRVNQYETQALSELFGKNGFIIKGSSEQCDVYVINTCAVTGEAERKSRNYINRVKKINPCAVVCAIGCFPQLYGNDTDTLADILFGNRNKNELVKSVLDKLAGEEKRIFSFCDVFSDKMDELSITDFERARAYVKISDGCDNHCSYCAIKNARGKLVSRRISDIYNEIVALAENGFSEIVLTGIETSSFGKDTGESLEKLISECSKIQALRRIRFGSLEPTVLTRDFIDILAKNPKIMPWFHISMQSASDKILALMKRKYNAERVCESLLYMKEKIKDVTLSADFITGFPSESDDDFMRTAEFVKNIGFLHLHVFPFSARKNTEAEKYANQVPVKIRKDRVKLLEAANEPFEKALVEKYENSDAVFSVLIEEKNGGYWYGHTENMLYVRLLSDENLRGRIIPVRLKSFEHDAFYAEKII